MGRFRGRLTRERPYQGVQCVLYTPQNVKVDVDVTSAEGYYLFEDVPEGNYEVRFFGRGYTSEDWISITIVENFGASEASFLEILTNDEPNENGWHNSNVNWYLSFDEANYTAQFKTYNIYALEVEPSEWTDWETSMTPALTLTGEHVVMARLVDEAGTVIIQASRRFNIDRTSPSWKAGSTFQDSIKVKGGFGAMRFSWEEAGNPSSVFEDDLESYSDGHTIIVKASETNDYNAALPLGEFSASLKKWQYNDIESLDVYIFFDARNLAGNIGTNIYQGGEHFLLSMQPSNLNDELTIIEEGVFEVTDNGIVTESYYQTLYGLSNRTDTVEVVTSEIIDILAVEYMNFSGDWVTADTITVDADAFTPSFSTKASFRHIVQFTKVDTKGVRIQFSDATKVSDWNVVETLAAETFIGQTFEAQRGIKFLSHDPDNVDHPKSAITLDDIGIRGWFNRETDDPIFSLGLDGDFRVGDQTSYLKFDRQAGTLTLVGTLRQRDPNDPGSAGPEPMYKGPWDTNEIYYPGDIVKRLDGSGKVAQYILEGDFTSQGQDPQNAANRPPWAVWVESGDDGGAGKFKSIVFTRSEAQPSPITADGGYDNPVPTEPAGVWTDGVPIGVLQLWSSTKIFSTNAGESGAWSTPSPMTSTADIEFLYNESTSITPPPSPTWNTVTGDWNDGWKVEATSLSVWMAKRDIKNGVEQSWEILKIKGEQGPIGDTGQTLKLEAESQVFSVADDGSNPTPATIRLTANLQNVDAVVSWDLVPDTIPYSGVTGNDRAIDIAYSDFSANGNTKLKVTATAPGETATLSDTVTIHKLKDGSDAYTVFLTNEVHTFPTDETGAIGLAEGSFETRLYKGAIQFEYDDSASPAPHTYRTSFTTSGITVTQATTANNQRKFTPSGLVGDASTGYVEVTITSNDTNESFVKKYSFSTSSAGANGVSWFKSIVFHRGQTEPSIPPNDSGGGDYNNPVPTVTDGTDPIWSDGIPSGQEKLWSTTRIFSDKPTLTKNWTPVQQMTDTANVEFLYNNNTSEPLLPDATGATGWYSGGTTDSVWMAIKKTENGQTDGWEIFKIKGEDGGPGTPAVNAFKSIAFARKDGAPPVGNGGSYADPLPTADWLDGSGVTQTWSDGVPPGDLQLWSTTRVFTEDGGGLQDGAWSTPVAMTNTETLEFKYSTEAQEPSDPEVAPGVWTNSPSPSSIWMAMRTIKNGMPQDWQISKIKGESGEQGDEFYKSVAFKRTNTDISSTRPTGGTWADPIPTDWADAIPTGQTKLWMSTARFTKSTPAGPIGDGWSFPRDLTDTSTLDVIYSVKETPSDPNVVDPYNSNDWFESDVLDDQTNPVIWMGTREVKNGVTSSWLVTRILGEQGTQGNVGPGIVYRGVWDAGVIYIHSADTRDIVSRKHSTEGWDYYIVNNPGQTASGSVWGDPLVAASDWTKVSSFDSVATKLLLAEKATITQSLVMGKEDLLNPGAGDGGLIRSASVTYNAASTPASYEFSQDGSGNDIGGFWIGYNSTTEEYESYIGDSNNYLHWDGTGLKIKSELFNLDSTTDTGGIQIDSDSSSIKMFAPYTVGTDIVTRSVLEISPNATPPEPFIYSSYGSLGTVTADTSPDAIGQGYDETAEFGAGELEGNAGIVVTYNFDQSSYNFSGVNKVLVLLYGIDGSGNSTNIGAKTYDGGQPLPSSDYLVSNTNNFDRLQLGLMTFNNTNAQQGNSLSINNISVKIADTTISLSRKGLQIGLSDTLSVPVSSLFAGGGGGGAGGGSALWSGISGKPFTTVATNLSTENDILSHPIGFTSAPTTALTGASVISRITVNAEGHVTGVSTRNITKGNISLGSVSNYGIASAGEAQAGTANNKYMTPLRVKEAIGALETTYTHPTGFTNAPATALSGASVISRVTVNSQGHVTGASTRDITKANIGLGNVTDDKQMPIAGGTFTGDVTLNADSSLTLAGDNFIKFGPGTPGSDDAHIEWGGASNAGRLRISTSDDVGTEYIEFGDYANTSRGGTFTEWVRLNRSGMSVLNDVSIANATFDANHALTGATGDARYGQLSSSNTWSATNSFTGNLVYDSKTNASVLTKYFRFGGGSAYPWLKVATLKQGAGTQHSYKGISGEVVLWNGRNNFGGSIPEYYKARFSFYAYGGSNSLQDSVDFETTAEASDQIRVVKNGVNDYELQVRAAASWRTTSASVSFFHDTTGNSSIEDGTTTASTSTTVMPATGHYKHFFGSGEFSDALSVAGSATVGTLAIGATGKGFDASGNLIAEGGAFSDEVDMGVNAVKWNNTAIYSPDTTDDILNLRRYGANHTLLNIMAPPQTSWGGARETTLALVRGDGNEYFMDLYNMDYGSTDSGNNMDYGDPKMGLRIQKRSTGIYVPFRIEYWQGTGGEAAVQSALEVFPHDTTNTLNDTSVNIPNKLTVGGSTTSSNAFDVSGKAAVTGVLTASHFRTPTNTTDYSQIIRNGGASALYVNQVAANDIATFSSSTAIANSNIRFKVAHEGSYFSTKVQTLAGVNSGFGGSGTLVDFANDYIETKDLTIRGRMSVYELLINQIRATNGSLWISSAAKAETVSGTGPYTITLKEEGRVPFIQGDLVMAQRFTGSGLYQVKGRVNSVSTGTDPESFELALEVESDVPKAGYEFVRIGNDGTLNTGLDRQGSVYLSADDEGAPFIDIIDDVDSFDAFQTQATHKSRFGNLEGIIDPIYGQLQGYGSYIQNLYASGNAQIAGTLTAGDANGVGNTFYAGRIDRNIMYSPTITWNDTTTNPYLGASNYGSGTFTVGHENTIGIGGTTQEVGWIARGSTGSGDVRFYYAGNESYLYSGSSKSLTFSMYMKVRDGLGDITSGTIRLSRSGDTEMQANGLNIPGDGGWHRQTVTGTWSVSPTNGRLYVIIPTDRSVYVSGVQLEEGVTVSSYQETTHEVLTSNGFGMWATRGGFGGTIQNPVVSLSRSGIKVSNAGYTADVNGNGSYIGNFTPTTGFSGTILNEDGLYGYQDNALVMKVDNAGALLGGWTIGASTISSKDITLTHSVSASSASIRLGLASGYNIGTGIWMDGSGKLRVGTSTGATNPKYFLWDGSNISWDAGNTSLDTSGNLTAINVDLTGKITASTGKIGGWSITPTQICQQFEFGQGISRYLTLSTEQTDKSDPLGLSLYSQFNAANTNNLRLMRFGQVSSVDTNNDWATTIYGIQIGRGSGGSYEDFFRIDSEGNFIIKTPELTVNSGNATFSGTLSAPLGEIGGFTLTDDRIHNNTGYGVGTATNISIKTGTTGTGSIYSGNTKLDGLSITWHQSSNAGHLVFGEIASDGNNVKTGFYGIQMMDWQGNEHFALSANTDLSGSREVYNRIGGSYFDTTSMWGGDPVKTNADLIFDFDTADITIGTGGSISGDGWEINETDWIHPSLGGLISTRESIADFGLVQVDAPEFDNFWYVDASGDENNYNSYVDRHIIKRVQWVKPFGMNTLVLKGKCYRSTSLLSTGHEHVGRVYLKIDGETNTFAEITDPNLSVFEVKLDVSGLTAGQSYEVQIEAYAFLGKGTAPYIDSVDYTGLYIREEIEIRDSTEQI